MANEKHNNGNYADSILNKAMSGNASGSTYQSTSGSSSGTSTSRSYVKGESKILPPSATMHSSSAVLNKAADAAVDNAAFGNSGRNSEDAAKETARGVSNAVSVGRVASVGLTAAAAAPRVIARTAHSAAEIGGETLRAANAMTGRAAQKGLEAAERRIVTAGNRALKQISPRIKDTNTRIVQSVLHLDSAKEARKVINRTKGKTKQYIIHQVDGKIKPMAKGAADAAASLKRGAVATGAAVGNIKRGVHKISAISAPIKGASKVVSTPIQAVSKIAGAENTEQAMASVALGIATKGAVIAPGKIGKGWDNAVRGAVFKDKAKIAQLGKKAEALEKKMKRLTDEKKDILRTGKQRSKKKQERLKGSVNRKIKGLEKKQGKLDKKLSKKKSKFERKGVFRKKLGKVTRAVSIATNPIEAMKNLIVGAFRHVFRALLPYILAFAMILFLLLSAGNLITSGAAVVAAVASNFVSEIIDAIADFAKLGWTPDGQLLEKLQNMNWTQYIADTTCEVLGESFVMSAKLDARNHYATGDKKITSQEMDQNHNITYLYNWYCDVSLGDIEHVWMREQCDRVTKGDGTVNGDLYKQGSQAFPSGLLYMEGGVLDTHSDEQYHFVPYDYDSSTDFSRINISPNANIVPIISMAHYRYPDEWTWENYKSIQAYVFYMYGLSHNTAHYDPQFNPDGTVSDKGIYSYTLRKSHSSDTLYMRNGEIKWTGAGKWNETAHTLDRPKVAAFGVTYTDGDGNVLQNASGGNATGSGYVESGCSNLYVHGYDQKSFFGDGAQAFGNDLLSAGKEVLSWFDAQDALPLADGIKEVEYTYSERTENGMVVKTPVGGKVKNADFAGADYGFSFDFSVAMEYAIGDNVVQPNGKTVWMPCDNLGAARYDSAPKCGTNTHEAKASCYQFICQEMPQGCKHIHGVFCNSFSLLKGGFYLNCSHKDGCPREKGTGSCSEYNEFGHTHTTTPLTDAEVSSHPADYRRDGCIWQRKDNEQVHTHKEWKSLTDPGCYSTVLFCKGHCGGHISPTVNLAVTYTFEGLAYQDAVSISGKDASFMSGFDFMKVHFPAKKTVGHWSEHVSRTTAKWFTPLPNGPISAVAWFGESFRDARLKLLQWWQNLKFFGNKDDDDMTHDVASGYNFDDNDGQGKLPASEEDEMGFTGWFDLSERSMLDTGIMHDLYSLYGEPATYYEDGIDAWKDFDVTFNIGMYESLSGEQKDLIVNAIREAYPELSGERIAVINDALNHVGYYNYMDGAVAHKNGMYSGMGMSDSTGFVSGVYMRALGSKCGFWSRVRSTFTSRTGEMGPHTSSSFDTDGISTALNQFPLGGMVRTTSRGELLPGDIVCNPDTNQAAIYLGKFIKRTPGEEDNPFATPQEYIVDCSSGNGGYSRCRKTQIDFSNYTTKYSPFQYYGIN